jgi:Domain of unknown function (DUF4440)
MKRSAIAFFAFSLTLIAAAQDAAPSGGRPSFRITTRTRTVTIFSDLETSLMKAVQNKDTDTLKRLAADDFEVRRSSAPAQPIPIDDWLARELPNYDLSEFQISDMAVHMFGENTASVSMRYQQKAKVNGKDRSGSFFIVDLWTKQGNDWRLRVRYAAPAELGPAASPKADKQPTGKE